MFNGRIYFSTSRMLKYTTQGKKSKKKKKGRNICQQNQAHFQQITG